MPLDYTHQHSSADIMQADDPNTPIDPSGGGLTNPLTESVEVADASIRVANTAPMLLSGATVALPVFVGTDDPAEDPDLVDQVIAGAVWIDTTVGPPYAQKVRNTGNDDWEAFILRAYNESEPTTYGTVDVLASGGGISAFVEGAVKAAVSVGPTEATLVIYDGFDIAQGVVVEPTVTTLFGALAVVGLPTSNPGAGLLWNDGGTVKVGT